MRSDESLDGQFVNSTDWQSDALSGKSGGDVDRYQLPNQRKARMSLSGSERNSAFIKSESGDFVNVSGNSGLDSASDGRCVGIIDLDRDGLQDFLVTSTNQPTLSIFRNRIDELKSDNNFVAVRVQGGNRSNKANTRYSNRDGIGALIRVETENNSVIREVRCGEGLATQNSSTYIIGMGKHNQAGRITVRWPSGIVQTAANIESGNVMTFHEDKSETEDETGFEISTYEKTKFGERPHVRPSVEFPAFDNMDLQQAPLTLVTAMATWCDTCQQHIPEFANIKKRFGKRINVYAIAVDAADSEEKLKSYIDRHRPAYELLPRDKSRSESFVRFAVQQIGVADVPFTVLVTPDGNVHQVLNGIPTISDLEKASWQLENGN